MKKMLLLSAGILCCSSLILSACNDDEDAAPSQEEPQEEVIDITAHKIVSNGNAAVTSITDEGNDNLPLQIVQTIPSFSGTATMTAQASARGTDPLRRNATASNVETRAGEDGTFPANLPIMFFFDDKLYLNSVEENVVIKADGQQVFGTIAINEGANGYAILTFTPWVEFTVNSRIEVVVKSGLQDKNGNKMTEDFVLGYDVSPKSEGEFSNNKGFENGTSGILFLGDGGIQNGTQGLLAPQEGSHFAAISSGNSLVSATGSAIGGTSSTMILGPINTDFSTLSFYYDFISAEFNDFVDSEFDDVAMITIYGPKGSYSEFLTSVNRIRYDNQQFYGFDMPDDGDSYAGHTGWQNRQIEINHVGTPAYVTFIITDVGDEVLSSILAVDNLNF